MAGKKKKEELLLKSLRELTALSHNKKCLECQERGPTYADMTTHGFVCTSCSGYLRGLNPPHRVKSISMTTFSEQELDLLKSGGNELAHAVWMGRWNPRQDKEPSKKDGVGFKEFLISKYERKQWFRNPAEVRKEREKDSSAAAPEPKLLPPPSTKRSAGTAATFAIQPPSSSSPSNPAPQSPAAAPTPTISSTALTNASTTATTAGSQKPDLLGGLESDPFAPKPPPPGAVAVFPPGGFPLINSAKQALQPANTGSSSSQAASSTVVHAGDKYAALASLDVTLKELRVKDEPSPPTQQHQMQGQGQLFGVGGGGGSSNPFGAPSGVTQQPQGQQFNPFAAPQSQPVTGGLRAVGQGYGAFQGAPGMMNSGVGIPPGQQFHSQQFGGFGQPNQQMGLQMQAMGQPVQPMGNPVQHMQQQHQQWGQQGFQGQVVQGQWRVPQGMQQAAMQQAAMQQAAMQQQQQWRAAGQQQQLFGGMPGGMVSQNAGGFGNMGMPQAQQQQQMAAQQSQFGGFVSANSVSSPVQTSSAQPSQQQPKLFGGGGSGGFSWGTNVASTSQPLPSASGVQTSAASSVRMGWSTDLAKQAPASSGWDGGGSATMTSVPTGWSTSLQTSPGIGGGWGGGGMNSGGWGGMTGVPSSQLQQQGNVGVGGNQPSNPFSTSPQAHRNPFL